jgi:hypothetical protein
VPLGSGPLPVPCRRSEEWVKGLAVPHCSAFEVPHIEERLTAEQGDEPVIEIRSQVVSKPVENATGGA